MKIRPLLSVPLALLLAFHPVRTEIAFTPEEGGEIYRSFEVTTSFGLEDLTMRMNDQEMPVGMGAVDPSDVEGEFTYTLEVLDKFEAISDGLPTKIARTYESIAFSYDAFDDSGEESMEELEGEQVVFTWNEEEETYDREWGEDSEGGDEDHIEPLAADLDLRALLPDDDVDVGDTWEVPASELGSLIMPGIDFERAADADIEGMEAFPVELADPLREAMEDASLECTFKGLRGGDDGELALIELRLSSETSIDVADTIAARLADESEMDADIDEFSIDLYVDFEGELLWDLALGHFHSMELSGDIALDVYASAELDVGEAQIPIELEGELSGELSIEATTVR